MSDLPHKINKLLFTIEAEPDQVRVVANHERQHEQFLAHIRLLTGKSIKLRRVNHVDDARGLRDVTFVFLPGWEGNFQTEGRQVLLASTMRSNHGVFFSEEEINKLTEIQ